MRATGELSTRLGDAERRVVDDRLMACVGDGVLTLAEYEEGAEVLWRPRTRPELEAIVAVQFLTQSEVVQERRG